MLANWLLCSSAREDQEQALGYIARVEKRLREWLGSS